MLNIFRHKICNKNLNKKYFSTYKKNIFLNLKELKKIENGIKSIEYCLKNEHYPIPEDYDHDCNIVEKFLNKRDEMRVKIQTDFYDMIKYNMFDKYFNKDFENFMNVTIDNEIDEEFIDEYVNNMIKQKELEFEEIMLKKYNKILEDRLEKCLIIDDIAN